MTTAGCELLCARERGEPPTYVECIEQADSSWVIRLAGKNAQNLSLVSGTSESALIDRCRELAEKRLPFAGGAAGWEAADLMSLWQKEGRIAISFLRIACCDRDEWVVHEIVPHAVQCRLVPIDELLSRSPIRLPLPETGGG